MPLILNDRVKETTATAGTGTVTLGGATAGFQSFANGIGNNNTTYYTILDSNNPPTFWEVGLGTYSNISNTLTRDTVYSSSDGGNKVNLAGVSFVFCDYPASQAVFEPKLVAGANITITKSVANNTLTIASTASGGGGSFSSIAARWTTANKTSKNAFISPGVVNADGITIVLTASANPGTLAAWTITLAGNPLANTYLASGAFPTYTITIPQGDLTGNPALIASDVTVALNNSGFNLTANDLTNIQPVAFTTTLSGNYVETSIPYYQSSATLNYSYTNQVQITSFGGIFTPTNTPLLPRNATSPSGQFANIDAGGCAISGTAIGNGLNGAATGATVNLTGSVPAVPTFVPAFYQQTANATPPTFNTGSTQTSGAAQGSMITYPVAVATTQYNWVCTQRPLANLLLVTPFGNSVLVPDVTAPTQTIAGQVFNVYGWTALSIGFASVLQIT